MLFAKPLKHVSMDRIYWKEIHTLRYWDYCKTKFTFSFRIQIQNFQLLSMNSLLRTSRSLRATKPTTRLPAVLQGQTQQRLNSHSSYGNGETKFEDDRNRPTRDIEHPGMSPVIPPLTLPPNHTDCWPTGPPPPNVSSENSSKSQPSYKQSESPTGEVEEDTNTRPSNNAKPTITDGHQSANVDEEGNMKPNVPEDVKRHNEDIDKRFDKPYNRINQDGKVGKGYWGKLDGQEGY